MRIIVLLILAILFYSHTVFAAQPLVDPAWLETNRNNEDLVILDLQTPTNYQRYHIPQAIHSNFNDWRQKYTSGGPLVMPPPDQLEKLIGSLGIDNQSHVVLVTTGSSAGEMASAARLYWSFKVLGHDEVSILNGGLIAYAQKRIYPLEKGQNEPGKKVFKAKLRAEHMPDAKAVKAALENNTLAVDNRSRAEYLGIYAGSGKERSGSLPNSVNLNYDWLTVNGGGQIHTIDNLKKIYAANNVPLTGPQINYCHTGLRASLGWFVSHELLGNEQARLYDGSTEEWASDPTYPVDQHVKLNF